MWNQKRLNEHMFQKTTIQRTSLVWELPEDDKVNKRRKYLNLHLIHLFLTGADCLRKPILYVN